VYDASVFSHLHYVAVIQSVVNG